MKKTLISLLLVFAMALSLCACGGKNDKPAVDPDASEVGSASSVEVQGSEIVGTVDEVKDFMFVIDAEDGCYYAFDTASLPENAPTLKVGDKVLITYEGELSEADNFTGKILSVEVTEEGNEGDNVAESTEIPLEWMTEHGFVKVIEGGTECSFDLDGDGKEEVIRYEVTPYQQGENGEWTESRPSVLSVNGVDFLSDDADNPMSNFDFWLENAYDESYYIVDVDDTDGLLEIGIPDWGSNDWLTTYLFRYENGELKHIGAVPAFPDSDGTLYSGDGTVIVYDHLNLMQSWSGIRTYVYQDGTFVRQNGVVEQTLEHSTPVYLRKELTVYTGWGKEYDTITLQPSDEPVQLPATDDEHWVQIIMADGTEGWIYFTEGIMMENGDEVVKADSVFEGLIYAG